LKDLVKNPSSTSTILPVILSGGTGSRLWPLSRQCYPKQYLKINNNSEYSLIQNSYLRLLGIKGLENPLIICNEEQRFIVAEQMREINVKPKSIILEPTGKNTAPAITLAGLYALRNNCDPHLLVVSSDHYIKDSKKFRTKILEGLNYSEKGRIVVFGTLPKYAETGYGYIEAVDELNKSRTASNIKRFVEKPDLELANQFLQNNHFSWNSGIFLFKASCIIEEIKKFQPKIFKLCEKAFLKNDDIFNFQRIDRDLFENCPDLSIDIAVMEKTSLGTVLSLDVGWSDIGTWNSLLDTEKKDSKGNFIKGKVFTKNSQNCYLRSEERLVVGIGLENMIVVETNDAILITKKELAQSLKEVVNELIDKDFDEAILNKKIYRPWGNYTSISIEEGWQVKKLEIKPSARLSLQLHHHRSEHWIVVKGTATVEIDQKITTLNKNESIFVPLGSKHRLSNRTNTNLVLIEVQSGEYLGEDDIERFEDIYGR